MRMDRLTFEGNFCDIAQCACMKCLYDTNCSQKQIWERLKRYEDTKRTPEQIEALEAAIMGKAVAQITEFEGLPIARLRELAVADKDGRCVVLPCKIGDKLYRVFAGEIFEHRVGSMKYFAIQGRWDIETYPFCPYVESSIGKTVFLSREEAEKALQEIPRREDADGTNDRAQ